MNIVAPYVGAWIETLILKSPTVAASVAPYVGAWIETTDGLNSDFSKLVAPYVGAWIETWVDGPTIAEVESRTLRGCVD